MLGSQEKFLEPKVNVKFFTVHPYTLCYRVSRPFLIWSIWQIWPLLGRKTCFSVVSSKRDIDYRLFLDDLFWVPPELFFGSFRVSDNRIQIYILILRLGALSTHYVSPDVGWPVRDAPLDHSCR